MSLRNQEVYVEWSEKIEQRLDVLETKSYDFARDLAISYTRIKELEAALKKQHVVNQIFEASIRERLGTIDQLPVDSELVAALRDANK